MSADAVTEARRLLESRLEELRSEAAELESALRGLGDGSRRRRRTAGDRGRRAGRVQGRPRRGQRAEQFKRALAKAPGTPVSEIAKGIGISPQQGHGIAKRLRERGEIKKQGSGYALKQ
jgi:DNA invertase Pin-like site-specific DNA recombinase